MSDAIVSYIGADNLVNTTDDEQRALYLKVFAGEVINSFEAKTYMLTRHRVRTITSGKSAQFPVIGRMPDAEYHTPGAEILGQEVPQSERVINIDKLLISHVFLDDFDEAMAHFEVRGKYSDMMGHKLSLTFDNHVLREVILAAQAAATITGEDGGLVVNDADLASATQDTKLQAWVDQLYAAATAMDNKFIEGERYCLLKPADYYFLAQAVMSGGFSVLHRDYGGEGSFADGNVTKIAGINLVKATTLPTADYSAESYHAVDATNTKALIFTEEAVGTVKLMDLSLQAGYDIRRQGTLLVARYAMGHGVLRPECAIQLRTAAP